MLDADAPVLRIALAVGLLAMAPLAGCLEPIGEATQEAIAGENATQQEPVGEDEAELAEDGEDDGEQAPLNHDTAETYEAAFDSIEPGNDTAEAASFDAHVELPSEEKRFNMSAYWNSDEQIVVVSFENGTPGAENGLQAEMTEGLVFATVNKTTLFGVPPSMMADYNASESWDEDPFDFSEASDDTSQDVESSEDSMNLSSMLEEVDELPEDANVSWNTITYQGDRAHEVEIQHENETDYIDLRAVIDLEEERPLLLEGTFENETGDRVTMEMRFAYGEDADHEYADELVRMEAMAISREEGSSQLGASNATQNWTVLPSQNPGMVALEEVEVHLRTSQGGSGQGADSAVTLPAEDGSLVNEDAELVYDDVDGDGAVSPGDQIRFTPRSEEAQGWSVSLHDEETGMHVTPGVGLVPALASLAGLAVLARTSRRRSG